MTLESAIKHCEDVADYDCFTDEQRKCSDEHRQLADWLRELKERREKAQLSGEDATFDCISRQAAIDAINAYLGLSAVSRAIQNMTSIQEILENLPSAEPRKKGTYTESEANEEWYCWCAICNECGSEWMGSRNFCPNCGAEMREGEEE